ncbi:MAG TPA: hypothetical protein VIM71_10490 [Lacunisphaera sp.]
MKFDAVRNAQGMRQIADRLAVVAIGWLASVAFGIWLPLAVGLAILVFRKSLSQSTGELWKTPMTRLAIVTLILACLLADWSSYRNGVFAGYDAAAGVPVKEAMPGPL